MVLYDLLAANVRGRRRNRSSNADGDRTRAGFAPKHAIVSATCRTSCPRILRVPSGRAAGQGNSGDGRAAAVIPARSTISADMGCCSDGAHSGCVGPGDRARGGGGDLRHLGAGARPTQSILRLPLETARASRAARPSSRPRSPVGPAACRRAPPVRSGPPRSRSAAWRTPASWGSSVVTTQHRAATDASLRRNQFTRGPEIKEQERSAPACRACALCRTQEPGPAEGRVVGPEAGGEGLCA
jgi:hypothetical protein